MQGMLVLVGAFAPEEKAPGLAAYYRSMAGFVGQVEGYHGASLWRNADGSDEYLYVFEYRDQAAAEAVLRASASVPTLVEEVQDPSMAADVARVELMGIQGRQPAQTEMGSFLSISRRMSAPGYGGELAEELERIFAELSVIPGYAGALWGTNEALAEEVVGIAIWNSREAYETSLPPGILHDVRLFRKAL